MSARIAADLIVLVHFAFVVFVVAGGALLIRHLAVAWLHLPALAWGAYAELSATVCPLTPIENALRARAGVGGYRGGFVEHYVMPLLYPPGLAASQQRWLGVAVIVLNVFVYAWALRRHGRWRRAG
jgi:hypothetical protein